MENLRSGNPGATEFLCKYEKDKVNGSVVCEPDNH